MVIRDANAKTEHDPSEGRISTIVYNNFRKADY